MAAKKKNSKRAEPTMPESLNTPEFTAVWGDWLRFSQDRGTPLAEEDAARQLKLLAKLGVENAIADVRTTLQAHSPKDHAPDQAEVAKKGKNRLRVETIMPDKDSLSPSRPAKSKMAKEPTAKKMSALDAAAKVLEEKGEPMNCQEMIDAMAALGYWKSPGGQTPAATLYSAILRETGKKRQEARFRKAARGKFVRA